VPEVKNWQQGDAPRRCNQRDRHRKTRRVTATRDMLKVVTKRARLSDVAYLDGVDSPRATVRVRRMAGRASVTACLPAARKDPLAYYWRSGWPSAHATGRR
jgi:hypothetical protein